MSGINTSEGHLNVTYEIWTSCQIVKAGFITI